MLKIVKNHKNDVKTVSKPIFGVQNHYFWLRNLGSKGDPQRISVGSWGKRSARDSERVVSSIYIYIYIYMWANPEILCQELGPSNLPAQLMYTACLSSRPPHAGGQHAVYISCARRVEGPSP